MFFGVGGLVKLSDSAMQMAADWVAPGLPLFCFHRCHARKSWPAVATSASHRPFGVAGDHDMKKASFPLSLAGTTTVMLIAGCASTTTVKVPELPAALRAASGDVAYLETLAVGVQIYECAAKPGAASGHEWQFRAPEAALTDRGGRSLGKHYAGPTWEGDDGSKVVGEVKARDPGPTPSAIPWLLLNAKSTVGAGVFAKTTSIQRVDTVAGVAPSMACDASNQGQMQRVPYTATYYFYRSGG
jgi:hypothetical protein